MSYFMAKTVQAPFDAVVDSVTGQLKSRGFGVLSDIDVQATMKAKIGAEMPRYRILGACNPRIANQALQAEPRIGVLLPCNVVVRELSDRETEVVAVDPVASLERTGNAGLRAAAEEVKRLLGEAVNATGG